MSQPRDLVAVESRALSDTRLTTGIALVKVASQCSRLLLTRLRVGPRLQGRDRRCAFTPMAASSSGGCGECGCRRRCRTGRSRDRRPSTSGLHRPSSRSSHADAVLRHRHREQLRKVPTAHPATSEDPDGSSPQVATRRTIASRVAAAGLSAYGCGDEASIAAMGFRRRVDRGGGRCWRGVWCRSLGRLSVVCLSAAGPRAGGSLAMPEPRGARSVYCVGD